MKRILLTGSMIAAFLVLNASVSHAQVTYKDNSELAASSGTATPTATVTTEIGTVLDLAVTTGSTVDFNFANLTLLDAGIEKPGAVQLTFRSNLPWFVNVATTASAANFTYTGTATSQNVMPASVLQYRLGGATTYTPMSATAQSVVGAVGAEQAGGNGTIDLDYKMNPGYVYAPGAYNISLTYTISNL